MKNYCYALFKRECLLAFRHRSEIIQPWLFFLLVIILFPLSLNPNPDLLMRLSPAIIWVAVLLSTVLSLEKLFRREVDDHMIEEFLLSPIPFGEFVFFKLLSSWLITYLPLFLVTPIIAVLLNLNFHVFLILLLTLLLGTPSLYFLGSIFSALTVRCRGTSVLLPLLTLPFYVPILIFATSSVSNAIHGLPVIGQLAFLGAMLMLILPLAPIATAAALKIGVL